MNPTVTLREITADTVRAVCALAPSADQAGFVASNALSLAQAHFEPTASFRAIYAGEAPVGFVMWRAAARPGDVCLWRFMIAAGHQKRGYARAALALLFSDLRGQGATRIESSFVAGEAGPRGFYRALGFRETGEETAHGEWRIERDL